MKVLVVGSGGREHALVWKLSQSPLVRALYAAPGNPGIARHATCVPIRADALDDLVGFAMSERIDLTVVGPEAPLVAGLADRFTEAGLPVFGPSAAASAIEGSKAFAKQLMAEHGIPTARFRTFEDPSAARRYCHEVGAPVVVKASGLAAGKGVVVCRTVEEAERAVGECMERRAFGAAGTTVVIEELLVGEEVSFFALANGTDAVRLAAAQDHKTVFDDDRGPNTGGMGAYAPVPGVDTAVEKRVMETIVRPTISALARGGRPYRGVLFVGLMMTADGPKVLEFNCRFGDPECQAILACSSGDLLPSLAAAAGGDALPDGGSMPSDGAADVAVCVTLASGGYPGDYRTGFPIEGVEAAEATPGVHVFHAGTARRGDRLVTAGGRVLGVTAVARDIPRAIDTAYTALAAIRFDGMHYRSDIARKALKRRPA